MNENYYLINLNQHQNDNNKSGNNNNNIDKNSENNNMSNTYEVNWNLIFNDIQSNLDILKVEGMKIEKIQEKIYQEINYEIERQNLVTKNSIKNPSIKSNIHKLLEKNNLPIFTGKWRKEAFSLRQYDPITEYVPTSSVSSEEGIKLVDLLNTNLDGYLGPAYNYDDRRLTEEWMSSFRDTSQTIQPNEDEVIKIQIDILMEIMLSKIQDQVCNDLKVLSNPPVGLGSRLVERPVWGIDSHTNRTIQLILEDYYNKNNNTNNNNNNNNNNINKFTIEEYKIFLERTLLPTINFVPTSKAYSMKYVLETIVHSSKFPIHHKEYAKIIISKFHELDPDVYFRIHPKGTGVICIDPEGIPAHIVIAEYLGELYPPYRWCEKLDVVQQAQKVYELKPTLPDFYNILLERPRRDERGYDILYVDASQRANLGSSCSHSCDPNCTSAVVARNGKLAIVLTTNRYVYPGEELCMDYYSITSSEVEWRASICFCGSLSCRGTFLHYATQDDLQQILNHSCGPVWRVATLLRNCTENDIPKNDLELLQHHGIGDIALSCNSPSWLKKYAIDTLRFMEYERKALPCALLRPKKIDSNKTSKDNIIQSEYNFTTADNDARTVLEQRMQSLLCSFSLIQKVLSKQDLIIEINNNININISDNINNNNNNNNNNSGNDNNTNNTNNTSIKDQYPLKMIPVQESISKIWLIMKTIPGLIKRYLLNPYQRNSRLKTTNGSVNINGNDSNHLQHKEINNGNDNNSNRNVNNNLSGNQIIKLISNALKELNEILNQEKPATMSSLRETIRNIRKIIISIKHLSTPTARLSLLSDILVLWCHTSNFVKIQEYNPVISDPIDVCARELGTTTISKDKLNKYQINKISNNKKINEEIMEIQIQPDQEQHEQIKTVTEEGNDDDNGDNEGDIESIEKEENHQVEEKHEKNHIKSVKLSRKKNGHVISLNPNDVIYTGKRYYSSTFIFWQLIGWFNAGTEQENEKPDLLGTCYLPLPISCFDHSKNDYTKEIRDIFLNHWSSDNTLSLPFPTKLRNCFYENYLKENQRIDDNNDNNILMLGSPVLDVSLGKVDAVDNCLNEMFGSNREKKVQIFSQLDEYLAPEKPTAWVQCERCLKWRRVPFHVNMDNFPDEWFCEYNTWDEIEKVNCDYPQDKFDSEKETTIIQERGVIEPVKIGDWKDIYCIRNHVYYEAKAIQMRKVLNHNNKESNNEKEIEKVEFKFHFRGWKSNQDEWIELGSNRIAPHHLYTDATSKKVKDQEKWQGLVEINDSFDQITDHNNNNHNDNNNDNNNNNRNKKKKKINLKGNKKNKKIDNGLKNEKKGRKRKIVETTITTTSHDNNNDNNNNNLNPATTTTTMMMIDAVTELEKNSLKKSKKITDIK